MITIIIADNFKKGMKSQGCVALLPFKKRSNLIEQQYDAVKKVFPHTEILYVYGFDAKRLNNYIQSNKENEIRYIYNDIHETVGQSYGLSLVRQEIVGHQECLLLLGYDPIKEDHLKTLKKSKRSASVVDDTIDTKLGCVINNNNIEHIFFDLENPISNMYLLKDKEVDILHSLLLNNTSVKSMFLFETINAIIQNGGEVSAIDIKKKVKNDIRQLK